MSLTNIYNERYGTSVATNDNYIAVGNPPTHDYDPAEGFYRIGEVVLIKRDAFNSNYSASYTFTKSLGTQTIYSTRFGESVDLSDYFLAVGNSVLSASVTKGSFVDVYVVDSNYNVVSGSPVLDSDCLDESVNTQTYSNKPFVTLTGSNSFGTSVSITNNYLAIGSPSENNNRGRVYIYQFSASKYKLESVLNPDTSIYPNQYGFGYSVSIDKKNQNRIVIGSNQLLNSKVYLYQSSSGGWGLKQSFAQVTGSLSVENSIFNWYPISLQNSSFGKSVSIYDKIIVIGAPTDLVYYEYSGSTIQRQRGAFYVYSTNVCDSAPTGSYNLISKLYGDENTFKDNFLGESVCVYNNNILVGSPKRYYPFASIFISGSLNFYENIVDENDFGASTFLGQVLYYSVTGSNLVKMTSYPISKRKESENSPFQAFGGSVSIYGNNIVIGSPVPLLKDYYLDVPYITESGSALVTNPSLDLTGSIYLEGCDVTSSVVFLQIEQSVTSDTGTPVYVSLCEELPNTPYTAIEGSAYIYNTSDLQTDFNIGNVFYNNNRIVINNTGSSLNLIARNPTDPNKPYIYMDYESLVQLNEKQYICTVEPGEFNISTNPTAVTGSLINYGIVNKTDFDFNNLDLILRYINYKITSPRSEQWWKNMVSGDVETSILSFYSGSYNITTPYTGSYLSGSRFQDNKLTEQLKCVLATKNFDVNSDGRVDFQDGNAIWKYFINNLTYQNYKNYTNPNSKRNTYDGMIKFLNDNTGKGNKDYIKKDFFNYPYSSSIDPTGSYLAPYITQVGLYSGADLVAIAKLAQPIKNSGDLPINIAVKWDT
jgi:hypothetical protein